MDNALGLFFASWFVDVALGFWCASWIVGIIGHLSLSKSQKAEFDSRNEDDVNVIQKVLMFTIKTSLPSAVLWLLAMSVKAYFN